MAPMNKIAKDEDAVLISGPTVQALKECLLRGDDEAAIEGLKEVLLPKVLDHVHPFVD